MLCDRGRGPEHWAMRGPVASGFPAAPRTARRARLESGPFVGRRDRRVIPGARGPGSVARTESRGSRGVCGGGTLVCGPGLAMERPRRGHFLPSLGLGCAGRTCAVPPLTASCGGGVGGEEWKQIGDYRVTGAMVKALQVRELLEVSYKPTSS